MIDNCNLIMESLIIMSDPDRIKRVRCRSVMAGPKAALRCGEWWSASDRQMVILLSPSLPSSPRINPFFQTGVR